MTDPTDMKEPTVAIACWSSKGGAGTTVVAAELALQLGRRSKKGAVLVDLAGDAPAVLGIPEPSGPGVADWLRSGTGDLPHAAVTPTLNLVRRGHGALETGQAQTLAGLLDRSPAPVVVDCGSAPEGVAAVMARSADQSLLVTRPCYIALRRFLGRDMPRPSGIVLIQEPGRVLTAADVAAAAHVPVVAELESDPVVARLVDSGLLAGRPPRSMRSLADKVDPVPLAAAFDHAGVAMRALSDDGAPVTPDPLQVGAW